MGRWARSKALASASWNVVRSDKELVVLPLISGIAALIVAATFAVPIVLAARDGGSDGSFQLGPVSYVLLFLMYVALAYVTIFFRTALITAADDRMRGGQPSLSTAIAGARSRAGAILPWAIVSATVSVVLRAVQERSGLLGRIVVGLVGMAWAVVTFMVLPVIVFEGVGVSTAVKRSAEILRTTWGENLIVNGGIGLIGFVVALPGILLIVLAVVSGSAPVIAVGVAVAVTWLVVVACVCSALTGVFQVALYRFATSGVTPPQFADVDLSGAFAQKGSRGRRPTF